MSSDRWKQIEEAYHAARDLSGDERSRFLDQRCGSDQALRQQIERLLAQDEKVSGFLNRPAIEHPTGLLSVPKVASLTGRRIGVYEVLEHIGSGGMGEVYRARDTKLNRDVALKVLPPAFAYDRGRVARFTREAQLLASLNHSNIAAIYGFEDADGVQALVLELVDGPTLADRIGQGPIPLDEAMGIARQIADAVEAAHAVGVIHRDLKPANIKVRPDDTVKVLDFGLAKALEPSRSTSGAANVATTEAGMILGTPAYMSPEQTKGRPPDKRTDVWAFGCVLYEMLTGRRAFPGDDPAETLAAVLRGEPDWSALSASTPAPVRAAIEGCLAKDWKERIADLSTAHFLLDERRHRALGLTAAPVARQATLRRALFSVGTLLLVPLSIALGWYMRPLATAPVGRFTITPAMMLTTPAPYRDIDISPDGSQIAYNTGTNPASGDLWVRPIDQLEAVRLQGLDMPKSPFFSADDQWVGFFARDGIRKASIKGGSSTWVAAARGGPQGASWSSQNTIVFATADLSTGLQTVQANGGAPAVLTTPNSKDGEVDHVFPSFLPKGDAVLFTVTTTSGIDHAHIEVLDLKTNKRKTLIRGGSGARYVDAGFLIYASRGALYAVKFDPAGLNVLSDPVAVVGHVLIKSSGAPDFSVSRTGTLAYVAGDAEVPQRTLVWVDRHGHEQRINAPPRAYVYPRLSSDGTRIALDIRDQENDIWVFDLVHEQLTRLTDDPAIDSVPVWTPDARDIIFASARSGTENLYRQSADGSRREVRLTTSAAAQYPLSISPDGTELVIRQNTDTNPVFGFDLFLLHLNRVLPGEKTSQAPIERLMSTSSGKDNGVISPDGRWIAYESNENESTQYQIYVRPFPNLEDGHWQVSPDGGRSPLWAPKGGELFYLDTNGFLMSAPVETSGTFQHRNPTRVLSTKYYTVNIRTYDVTRDGEKFVMIKSAEGDGQQTNSSRGIILVQNWSEELKQRVPGR